MARSTATTWWLVGLTPVIMLLTHYLAVLPHEFSHSVAAWIVGIKPVPGDITWGGTSLWNVTLLAHVDENVDYSAALAAGRYREVAVAAAAGPVIGNALPYLVVRGLIFRGSFARSRPVWLYVVFWYLFYGVANLYDYVPTRVFADDGDVTHFVEGSHVDRWWIYAVGTALVVWAIADLYRTVLPRVLGFCDFSDLRGGRALVLVAATAMLFGYFAIPALEESDPLSSFMGRTSLLLIPVVLVATWRRVVLDDLPTEPRRAEVLRLAPVGVTAAG